MGGTYYDHPVKNGPFLHCNFPKLQLAMPSFDSRTIDDVVLPKALNYISAKAEKQVKFQNKSYKKFQSKFFFIF